MSKLLLATPKHILFLDTETGHYKTVQSRPEHQEYYGISWNSYAFFLGHSYHSLDETFDYEGLKRLSHGGLTMWQKDDEGDLVVVGESDHILTGPHQIEATEKEVFVANTGRNNILVFTIEDDNRLELNQTIWPNPKVKWDKLADGTRGGHYNSVHLANGALWVVSHNWDRTSEVLKFTWRDGQWKHQETRVIHMAAWSHNVWVDEVTDRIWTFDSLSGEWLDQDGNRYWTAGGIRTQWITRGLGATEKFLFVGGSAFAHRARRATSDSAVFVVDWETLETKKVISLPNVGCINELRVLDEIDDAHNSEPFPFLEVFS